jgi:hypothetical protein
MNSERIRHGVLSLTVLLAFIACTPRTYLMIDYRVPPPSERLQGQQVRIEIKDLRSDHQIFTPTAQAEFENFNNRYKLSVIADKQTTLLGEKNLQGLFLAAFKKRLKRLDADIAPPESAKATLFQILIQEIHIDLQDHKWAARIRYEADLVQDNRPVARETVSGTAERVRILGSGGADEALSDIFTDVINRLDIVKLFQRAKLTTP